MEIIIGIIGIILVILIIRFVVKSFFRIVFILLIIGAAVYFLFYHNGGLVNLDSDEFILDQLEEKYCREERDDTRCDCIVMPVKRSMRKEYSHAEMKEIRQNKLRAIQALLSAMTKERKEIKQCLRDRNALDDWDEFIDDVKSLGIGDKLKDGFQKLKEAI